MFRNYIKFILLFIIIGTNNTYAKSEPNQNTNERKMDKLSIKIAGVKNQLLKNFTIQLLVAGGWGYLIYALKESLRKRNDALFDFISGYFGCYLITNLVAINYLWNEESFLNKKLAFLKAELEHELAQATD